MNDPIHPLRARRLHLLTQDEAIVLMRSDCPICKSEGLAARARVLLRANGRTAVATLYQIDNDLLRPDEAGLSEAAWRKLSVDDGDPVDAVQAPSLDSLAEVRRRVYGGRLDESAFREIISDVVAGYLCGRASLRFCNSMLRFLSRCERDHASDARDG